MIVVNYEERYWEIMHNGFGKYPNARDMSIVTMYERKNGSSDKEICEKIVQLCKKNNENFNFRQINKKILKCVREAEKNLKNIKCEIKFTQKENSEINKLEDIAQRKVLYVLMAICKAYGTDYVYLNGSSPIKTKDIVEMTGLQITNKKFEQILHDLYTHGCVSVLPNLKYTIECFSEDDDIAFIASACSSVIEEYDIYNGLAIRCQECGSYVKKRSNNTKYCAECAKKIKAQQNKEWLKNRKVKIG